MPYPHKCFTEQLFGEPCPKCRSGENVFMGHGKVRTCMTCILSWAAGEMIAIDFAEGEASKTTDLPPALKKRISELEQDLKSATDITRRLKQLISIADDDWDRAENAS